MNNQEIFANYYQRYREEIVDFIMIRVQDREEAQDMVQNLFLRLLTRQQLVAEQSLPSLIYTMARHMVADYYRRRHVYEEYEHYIRHDNDSDDSIFLLVRSWKGWNSH